MPRYAVYATILMLPMITLAASATIRFLHSYYFDIYDITDFAFVIAFAAAVIFISFHISLASP